MPDPVWIHELEMGSAFHAATIAACVAGGVAVALRARRLAPAAERRVRRAWIGAILAVQAVLLPLSFQPSVFDVHKHLPLHLCDVAVFVAAFALWSERRWLRALTYFWGIGLSTQAFLTPAVLTGVAHISYWLFWAQHAQILGSAVYDVLVLRFRPTARDWLTACAGTVVYGLCVLPINLAFDLNYGFVGKYTPEGASVLDYFPPWPWRMFVMGGLASLLMLVLWLAWPVARGLRALVPGRAAA